jgi:predicted DNA-binding transcriptional regulator YafY
MAKRSDTKETVLLALELLRRIPRNSKISAPDLHKQLSIAGVSRDLRTIQRQLEMLSEHFEIERDERNKPYGYRWKERAKGLALPMLSEQESLLLTLAEKQLGSLLPATVMKSMEGFFAQARANIGQGVNAKREREWLSKIRVVSDTQPLLPPKIVAGVLEEVSNALYANLWLTLDYKNAAGKRATVEVMPLGLAQQGPRLYLVCRFKDYDNERSLALHRIISAKSSSSAFIRPKEFDFQKYDDDGRFGFGDGERVILTFRIERDAGLHLLESPLSADQQVLERQDGTLEITATVVDSGMLEWWLRGFGDAVNGISKTRQDSGRLPR